MVSPIIFSQHSTAQQQWTALVMKNLLVNLPEDLLINNILLSKVLPIKSLFSLICVCKYLRNLITNPTFTKMQISTQNNNNNNHPLVLIASTYRPNVFFSLKFNGADPCHPEEVEFVSPIDHPNIWGSCNGLLCLSNDKGDTVCLWNPSTKEYKVLPPPLSISLEVAVSPITYGFGYDHLIDDYKIIRSVERLVRRFNDCDGINMTEFQVYTLGTNTWRKINNNPYKSYFVLWLIMVDKPTVFVNGALHWMMSTSDWLRGTTENTEAKIISFDIEKEEFREISTPSLAKFEPEWSLSPRIQGLRGCLCVLEFDSDDKIFNVWMMKDYGVEESWTKLFTIALAAAEVFDITRTLSSYTLLSFCENDSEILMTSNNVVLVYSLINDKARPVEFAEKVGKNRYESVIYIESLVSLNSGVYEGERRIRVSLNSAGERRIRYKRRRRIRSKNKKKLIRDFDNINLAESR